MMAVHEPIGKDLKEIGSWQTIPFLPEERKDEDERPLIGRPQHSSSFCILAVLPFQIQKKLRSGRTARSRQGNRTHLRTRSWIEDESLERIWIGNRLVFKTVIPTIHFPERTRKEEELCLLTRACWAPSQHLVPGVQQLLHELSNRQLPGQHDSFMVGLTVSRFTPLFVRHSSILIPFEGNEHGIEEWNPVRWFPHRRLWP